MILSWTLTALVLLSILSAAAAGQTATTAAALQEGAVDALNLLFSLGPSLCVWSGVLEVLERSGGGRLLSGPLGGSLLLSLLRMALAPPVGVVRQAKTCYTV